MHASKGLVLVTATVTLLFSSGGGYGQEDRGPSLDPALIRQLLAQAEIKPPKASVTLQADPTTQPPDAPPRATENRRIRIQLPREIRYKIQIVRPDPSIDYKILVHRPDPSVDYKIVLIDPDTKRLVDRRKSLPFPAPTREWRLLPENR
jgi:hypothetical protein